MENKQDNFINKLQESLNKPVTVKKPNEEVFDQEIVFPDQDATSDEVSEYLETSGSIR